MRDDPIQGEQTVLLIEFADSNAAAVEEIVEEYDGELDRNMQFVDVAAAVPEEAVASLCELDGIERIETGDTLEQTPSGAEE